MKKIIPSFLFFLLIHFIAIGQTPQPPDVIYGKLFTDVQMAKIFPDGKTFVDCTPKRDPKKIVKDYLALEQMRFEERLKVEMSIDEDTLEQPVPPMMLQTLPVLAP